MSSQRIFINFNTSEDINTKLLIDLLKQHQITIYSCVGPHRSKLKFITRENNSGDFILTNTSKNLFTCLYKIDHLINKQDENNPTKRLGLIKWQFDLIKTVVENAFFNHFYDSGLFLCSIINEFIILNFENAQTYSSDLLMVLNELTIHLNQSTENSLISIKLNLNNVHSLKNLLRTCLGSKCVIGQLVKQKKETFIDLCTKAFVNSFNSESQSSHTYFSDIMFLFEENLSLNLGDSMLFEGVLFEFENYLMDYSMTEKYGQVKVVLFDSTFSGDFEHLNNLEYKFDIINSKEFGTKFIQLKKMIEFLDELIEKFKIGVILCQKVCKKKHL